MGAVPVPANLRDPPLGMPGCKDRGHGLCAYPSERFQATRPARKPPRKIGRVPAANHEQFRASFAPVSRALTSGSRRVLFRLYAAGFLLLRPGAGAGKAATTIQQKSPPRGR